MSEEQREKAEPLDVREGWRVHLIGPAQREELSIDIHAPEDLAIVRAWLARIERSRLPPCPRCGSRTYRMHYEECRETEHWVRARGARELAEREAREARGG